MNGMQAKKLRRDRAKRSTEDGLPRDGNDWREEDWSDLYMAMEWVRRRVRERHQRERDATSLSEQATNR